VSQRDPLGNLADDGIMRNLKMVAGGWLLVACLVGSLAGCASHASSAAQKQSQTIIDKGTIDSAHGTANPLAHPLDASNNTIAEQHRGLGVIVLISFLALAIGTGLDFTSFSWATKQIVPVAGTVLAFSEVGIFTLPYIPWIAGGTLIALGIYEIVRLVKGGLLNSTASSLTTQVSGFFAKVENATKTLFGNAESLVKKI
jgi:hypothetical protein